MKKEKLLKAANRLKRYCNRWENCHDCIFYSPNGRESCSIRCIPEEYDLTEAYDRATNGGNDGRAKE